MNVKNIRLRGLGFACALLGSMALCSAAIAQDLDIWIDLPLVYTAGDTVPVVVNIERIDAESTPDSNVTAMGIELNLPTGWTLARDPNNNCASAFVEELGGSPVNPAVNAVAVFKDAAQTYADPPNNTTCIQLPLEGFGLEFIWIPNNGGGGEPLPINLPLQLTVPVVAGADGECGTNSGIYGIVRYRVLTGSEETGIGGELDEECVPVCETEIGDSDSSGVVDIDDVQQLFEYVIAVVPSVDEFCSDVCGDGIVDIDDVQGIFNMLIQLPNPCSKK